MRSPMQNVALGVQDLYFLAIFSPETDRKLEEVLSTTHKSNSNLEIKFGLKDY